MAPGCSKNWPPKNVSSLVACTARIHTRSNLRTLHGYILHDIQPRTRNSLDYRHHRIHVNKHTATYEPDGSVRIVVAHRDPGLPNWIDTVGHESGTMCFRWVRAQGHPQPRTRVVPLSELLATRGRAQ